MYREAFIKFVKRFLEDRTISQDNFVEYCVVSGSGKFFTGDAERAAVQYVEWAAMGAPAKIDIVLDNDPYGNYSYTLTGMS